MGKDKKQTKAELLKEALDAKLDTENKIAAVKMGLVTWKQITERGDK
jgi:hypothetical protein